jgi:hypothetical protein
LLNALESSVRAAQIATRGRGATVRPCMPKCRVSLTPSTPSLTQVTACALAFALTAAAASRHAADWAESSDTTDASGGVLRLPLWTLLCGYVLLGCSAVQARCEMQRDRLGCGAGLG